MISSNNSNSPTKGDTVFPLAQPATRGTIRAIYDSESLVFGAHKRATVEFKDDLGRTYEEDFALNALRKVESANHG